MEVIIEVSYDIMNDIKRHKQHDAVTVYEPGRKVKLVW